MIVDLKVLVEANDARMLQIAQQIDLTMDHVLMLDGNLMFGGGFTRRLHPDGFDAAQLAHSVAEAQIDGADCVRESNE